MIKRNVQKYAKLQSMYIRKYPMAFYRQIVDPKLILLQQEKDKQQNSQIIEKYDRIYKPERSLEFDRKGEIVLYTSVPLKNLDIYLKWPKFQIDMASIFFTLNYCQNWFSWSYQALTVSMITFWFLSFMTRTFSFQNLMWHVSKVMLLKGGKILIVERSAMDGTKYRDFVEIAKLRPISEDLTQFDDQDKADFLDSEGQLKYMLAMEGKDYILRGYSIERQVIKFLKQGVVNDPELFEAVMKGYHIDTSNFVINTENSNRAFESIGNY